jgi:glycosyltransferase involved in cell wall biosynthesis
LRSPARRIAVIASSRYPIAQPFAGGLEAQTWLLTSALRDRGHEVLLFAADGSDPALGAEMLRFQRPALSELARQDVSMPPEMMLAEHHAYLSLMFELSERLGPMDLVHNHSLHYLPIAAARLLRCPVITTLHTPPTPWLESAIQIDSAPNVRFAAVSAHTATSWSHLLPDVTVVPNGIDLRRWPVGPGGDSLVWFGRIVREKAPHLAIAAARLTGRRLVLAGPIIDKAYYDAAIRPFLGDLIRYAGHLDQAQLSRLVGTSAVALVTPEWDEPYGLVVAEALASGTPVVSFARGGIVELLDDGCGRLVPPGNVAAMAAAIPAAQALSRAAVRARAEQRCSAEAMLDAYEQMFDAVSTAAA